MLKESPLANNPYFFFHFQADEGEEVPGPSQKHHFSSLQRDSIEADQLSLPPFLHSSSLPDHADVISQRQNMKYSNLCSQSSYKPSRPRAQNSPISGFDHQLLNSHIQQTELFRQFCQELVTIHRDMANNMLVISQKMADLTGQVSQMCQTLTKIRDELQTLNKGQVSSVSQVINLQTAVSKSPSEPKADIDQSHPKQSPPVRTTRTRKRKHNF